MDDAPDRSGDGASAEDTDEKPGWEDSDLSMDDVFHLLQNRRRRDVLRYLESVDGETELSELAEHVAAREHDTTVEALSSKERKRVYVALYQSHLPKLDEMDVIEYDQHRGSLSQTPRAELLSPYLRRPDEGREDEGTEGGDGPRAAGEDAPESAERPANDGGIDASPTRRLSADGRESYYLGPTTGAALFLLVGLDISVFAALSWFHVAAATLLAFTAITALLARR